MKLKALSKTSPRYLIVALSCAWACSSTDAAIPDGETSSTETGGAGAVIDDDDASEGNASGGNTDVPSATGGGSIGTGGDSDTGGGSATGGEPGTIPDNGPPAAPEGVIPNKPYPADKVNLRKDQWKLGLISPTLESEHHNQPSVINGYLQLTGNSRYSIYDISDPTSPVQLSFRKSPDDDPRREAEGHQVSYAKYGNKFYAVTIQGKGVDIWDITDVRDPKHVDSVHIDGVNFGDFTEAVWGVAWQGTHIFVGGTNTGVHVIDATDPTNASLVGRQANIGGVNAGPLFAIGNTLVVTTPKNNRGIATLDISNPKSPVLLDSLIPPNSDSYIGWFYGHHAYLLNPIRVYDVLTNPTDIQLVNGSRPGGYFEYMSFQDGHMFAGRIRPEPGATKIDVRDISNFKHVSDIYGRRDLSENDDQFTVAIGNLLVLSDDQLSPVTNRYAGTVIAVHDVNPDTAAPVVDTIRPAEGAIGQAVTSRVGISFTDNVELATVDSRSFIVRPVGGQALPGTYSVTMSVLSFDPDGDFAPGTTYEVILPAGGIKDYVGNGIEEEFRSTFTTK